ncbi:MAG: HAD family hydrolase [Pseudomonadota bacterium]|nr:HAD family hydrolase [Pseudomonadota bacterium]
MWSGPRNISTAMMYSFGNRPDCFAWDEPFYAFALLEHGNDHPLRREILAAYETDFGKLAARCLSPPPAGQEIFYQKHMTHHMLKGFDRGWIGKLTNAFLIRAPEKVLASYVRKWAEVSLRDIGFVEQSEIFHMVADRQGAAPPVIDADDVLAGPRCMLTALCAALGIPFRDEMLAWPKGPKSFDGLWARHWYEAAWNSTGFAPDDKPAQAAPLPDPLRKIADAARPFYEALRAHRLALSATN